MPRPSQLLNLVDEDLINPLKKERLALNLTPELLAKEAQIQIAAVGQAEDGLYTNPLPAYLLAIGIPPNSEAAQEITKSYHEWKVAKRIKNGPSGTCKLILDPVFKNDENPLASWRHQSGLSTYGFCCAFCIHLPTVNKFEKDIISFGTIPPSNLSDPLTEAGYDLSEFIEASILYKATLLNKSRLANNLPLVTP